MDIKLAQFLLRNGVEQRHIDLLKENEVCSMAFGLLADKDFTEMGFKIGSMRHLIALREKWSTSIKRSETNVVPRAPALNNDFKHPVTSGAPTTTTDKIELAKMQAGFNTKDSPVFSTSSTDVLDRDVQAMPVDSELGIAPAKKRITLPEFSARVASALQHGKACHLLNAVVDECAYHILAHGNMSSKGEYAEFSRLLCEKYTCLQFVGRHHWSYFSKKLSQKMRNIRYRKKRTADVSFCSIDEGDDHMIFDNEELLAEEYSKHDPDWSKISALFKQFHGSRRQILADMPMRSVHGILKKFPYLFNMKLIREEFDLLTPCPTSKMTQRYRNMLSTVDKMIGAVSEGTVGTELLIIHPPMLNTTYLNATGN